MDELKKQLELLISFAKSADVESILNSTFEDEIEDTIELLKGGIEVLTK